MRFSELLIDGFDGDNPLSSLGVRKHFAFFSENIFHKIQHACIVNVMEWLEMNAS